MDFFTKKNVSALLLAGSLAFPVLADTDITVGTPDKDGGKVIWEVTTTTGKKKLVEIQVPNDTTAAGKAKLLEIALKKKGLKVVRNGAKVTIKNAKKAEKFQDETHENDVIAAARAIDGSVGFDLLPAFTNLAGVDEFGSESLFTASIGFDGIVADAILNFSQLSGNSVDALLSDVFDELIADLPAIYHGNLALNLAEAKVDVIFPLGTADGLVQSYTNDLAAFSTLALAVDVDESSMPAMFSLMLLCSYVTRRRYSKAHAAVQLSLKS